MLGHCTFPRYLPTKGVRVADCARLEETAPPRCPCHRNPTRWCLPYLLGRAQPCRPRDSRLLVSETGSGRRCCSGPPVSVPRPRKWTQGPLRGRHWVPSVCTFLRRPGCALLLNRLHLGPAHLRHLRGPGTGPRSRASLQNSSGPGLWAPPGSSACVLSAVSLQGAVQLCEPPPALSFLFF